MALRSFSSLISKASRCRFGITDAIGASTQVNLNRSLTCCNNNRNLQPLDYQPGVTLLRYFDSNSKHENITYSKERVTCNLDLSGYNLSNVTVNTVGNKVVVDAEMEVNAQEAGFQTLTRKTLQKWVSLPNYALVDEIQSELKENGKLSLIIPVLSANPIESSEKLSEAAKEDLSSSMSIVSNPVQQKQPHVSA